jgi:hypothetical protein
MFKLRIIDESCVDGNPLIPATALADWLVLWGYEFSYKRDENNKCVFTIKDDIETFHSMKDERYNNDFDGCKFEVVDRFQGKQFTLKG